jgi:hypothetical protein
MKKRIPYPNSYHRLRRKIRQAKNRKLVDEKEANQFDRFYATINGRATHMLNNSRARAKRNKIDYTLTKDWIENILKLGVCQVTGIPFELKHNGGKGHRTNSFSPSLDRIQQTGPYSPDNVRIVCWIYNRARGAFPDNDFDRMIQAIQNLALKTKISGNTKIYANLSKL